MKQMLVIALLATWTDIAFPAEEITVELPGGGAMELIKIEPGTFKLGSRPPEEGRLADEAPQHDVTLSKGFYLGKFEVTRAQWESVMETTPWLKEGNGHESGNGHVQENGDENGQDNGDENGQENEQENDDGNGQENGDENGQDNGDENGQDKEQEPAPLPAVDISWDDAQSFVQKLNEAAGDSLYRLPTEAEWEYACRAGTTTRWSFGDDELKLEEYAWYVVNTEDMEKKGALGVGTKSPNPWGLYDMHGNVWEWCHDFFGEYPEESQTDPTGPEEGKNRVIRGGNFGNTARSLRSAYRYRFAPDSHYLGIGMRLVKIR
jgi:formylglycine-generating enzyme required for sulfatase activity